MKNKNYSIRYEAGQPVKKIFSSAAFCRRHEDQKALLARSVLCTQPTLNIFVWNIFKQQRLKWRAVLEDFGRGTQLMLLQEAHSTPELIQFATSHYQVTDQVPAFTLPPHPAGVMTLAAAHSVYCCPLREREPLLRLVKSALITVYPLQDGQLLMVINIHAINFSFGINVYSRQLDPIGVQIKQHTGPVIMAGDFNAWNKRRMDALYEFAFNAGLHEVIFTNDQRRTAFGRPLDFVFYRGATVVRSTVLVTQASDHNPLLIKFKIAG